MLDFGFYNMDSMHGLKSFPDKFFDLALVDPAYGRKEHGGRNRSGYIKQKNGNKLFVPDGNYIKMNWDYEPAYKSFFDEIFRVSKNQIIWGENYYSQYFGPGRIIWDKCNDGSDQSDCEIAYNSMTYRVDIIRYMWRGMMQGKSITEGWIQQGDKSKNERRIHPTQKPVVLYEWQLGTYAKPGWKILDPNVGSASSLIACHNLGFDFVGFEIDKTYYDMANARFRGCKGSNKHV
jgi:site-specific DNA-methyltransferase (adenine-specific)